MTVRCWGSNRYSQCNQPDSIQGRIVSVKCGSLQSSVLLNDNTIKCWGYNKYNQCDQPDSIQNKVISIVLNEFISCALLNDNTVKCWGDNKWGHCNVPDSIQGKVHNVNINNDNVIGMVVSIECGYAHYCAILNDNRIVCWGNNMYGQCNVPDSVQGNVIYAN
jgi:alpha-tubulin suppressor-like RCC1 family protein